MDWSKCVFIFDIDGTVTDSQTADDKCFVETFEEMYNVDLSNVQWQDFEHVTDAGLSKELVRKITGREITRSEMDQLTTMFVRRLTETLKKDENIIRPVHGVIEFLRYLESLRIPVTLATGGWRKSAELKLRHAGIPYDPFTLATSNDNFKKRTIINIAIARVQFHYQQQFSQFIYFGDGIWDANTCEAMDIPMIGLDIRRTGELKKNTWVSEVISNFDNITGIFENIKYILKRNKEF